MIEKVLRNLALSQAGGKDAVGTMFDELKQHFVETAELPQGLIDAPDYLVVDWLNDKLLQIASNLLTKDERRDPFRYEDHDIDENSPFRS